MRPLKSYLCGGIIPAAETSQIKLKLQERNMYEKIFTFRRQIRQLLAATIIAMLAVGVSVLTMYSPSEDTWRAYFAFKRCLLPSMVTIGIVICGFHAGHGTKKPSIWLPAILIVDTFGLLVAVRVALAITMQVSLALAFISPWNVPLTILGGVKPFQLVDFACVALFIPSMLWALGFMMECALSYLRRISKRKKNCNAIDIDRHMIVVCGIRHRFSQAGAAYRVKDQVKAAMRDFVMAALGESAYVTERWHDSDDTVDVEVSAPSQCIGKASSEIAFGLAKELARIDEAFAKP